MSKLETLSSAPKFWGKLLEENPIVALTGVTYNHSEKPHGIPSNNKPIQEHDGMFLDITLSDGKWPYFGPVWCRRPGNEFEPQTFAVGSLVYLWPGRDEESPYFETKAYARHLNYEQEMPLAFLERYGIKPMAIVMVDIDYPDHEGGFKKIISTLKNSYEKSDWTVLETEQSFHVVFSELINPKNIPWHYGGIIKAFASTEESDKKGIIEKIGEDLQHFYNRPDKIREVCGFILEKVRHFDDPDPDGIHFIIDLRWIAHSLIEFLNYQNTGEGSFGFLRISDKDGRESPPKMVFKNYS